MTAHRLARIAFGALLWFAAPALAETPDSLQWKDLIPQAPIPENPIKRLSPDRWTEFEEAFTVFIAEKAADMIRSDAAR